MLHEFIQLLSKADKSLFLLINQQGHAGWLDGFMLLMRDQNTWIPLYLIVLITVYRLRPGAVIPFVLASVVTFAICDYGSASIIKPLVSRLRPCYDGTVSPVMRHLIDCGGRYSFPSTHATNHFGLATVWFQMMIVLSGKRWYWVWPWALVICYAQVYVGKHFPMDIAGGALMGTIAGLIVSRGFNYWSARTGGRFFYTKQAVDK